MDVSHRKSEFLASPSSRRTARLESVEGVSGDDAALVAVIRATFHPSWVPGRLLSNRLYAAAVQCMFNECFTLGIDDRFMNILYEVLLFARIFDI